MLNYDLAGEVERTQRVPGIVFARGTSERVPRIAGTGTEVSEIIGAWKAAGSDWAALRHAFDLLAVERLGAAR